MHQQYLYEPFGLFATYVRRISAVHILTYEG